MKKLLLLGGSAQQVVAIETAKKLGFDTVLCDYLPDNPGQYAADKFYLVSTTDKDAVLKVAEFEKIDGILAYASDPAAPTAAYVAEKLNLPGNPYESVRILCDKNLFRNFLKEHDFCTPEAAGYTSLDEAVKDCKAGRYRFPIISKPVDSSGSKGVVRIEKEESLYKGFEQSMHFSKTGEIIVEEYVDSFGYQIAGDGLSVDGEMIFHCFGNDHFNSKCKNPFVPISASFPCQMPEWLQEKALNEVQRLITLLQMNSCVYNFDIRVDKDYKVYLMEVAPRSGGNYIPQVVQYATGVDLVECAVKVAVGEKIRIPVCHDCDGFWSYFAVHSLEDGLLSEVRISPDVLTDNVIENHIIKHPGDKISAFTGANMTLGCLIMKFNSMDQMLTMMDHGEEWIQVILEK